MEGTTALRQNHTLKKKNKENVQPAQEVKSFIKQNISKAAQLQTNGNKKEISTKTVKAPTVRQAPRKQNVTEQVSGKTTTLKNPATAKKQDTGAQIRKTEPTPAPPPSRAALGLYKGKIIESKIGSIWKSSAPVRNEEQKPTALIATNPKATSAAGRGTSATGRGTAAAGRGTSESVKPAASSFSARPPVRSVPTTARPRNATVAQSRRCGTLIAKPQVPVTDVKKSRPPVTSTVGQYRANNETEEEKRAKLAEWLASKGKTLKRPAMVPSGASTKVKTTNKPSAPAAKSQTKAQVSMKSRPTAEVKEHKPVPPAVAADNQEEQVETDKRISLILNTTLDLLENSDADLPVASQDGGRVDDIVMNLCDALEALEPPSQCDHELLPLKDESSDDSEATEDTEQDVKCETPEEVMMKKETPEKVMKKETPEKVMKKETPEKVMVKSEAGIGEEQEECEESDDDCYVDENEPPTEDASVVKYSVKTTPFLQSVKKTIDDEVCSSSSKRKSNIKDLKFLTPVRRSSRIHRQSSRLPLMLVDHDPCVSSLAELVQLDDDPHAYIYRKNTALLEDLPDQPRV